jgi:RNA recognition motif-containing protein
MSTRLYVGNLSFSTTADGIRDAFAQAGEVSDVYVVMDRETGRPRGFAFVTMATPDAAQNAIRTLNGAVLDGRPLRVNEAEERPRGGGGGGGGGPRPPRDFGGGGGGGGRGGGGGGRGGDRGGDRGGGGRGRW